MERPSAVERQRLRVKRRYHRALQSLDEARQLVEQLTQTHRNALEQKRSLAPDSRHEAMRSTQRPRI